MVGAPKREEAKSKVFTILADQNEIVYQWMSNRNRTIVFCNFY